MFGTRPTDEEYNAWKEEHKKLLNQLYDLGDKIENESKLRYEEFKKAFYSESKP